MMHLKISADVLQVVLQRPASAGPLCALATHDIYCSSRGIVPDLPPARLVTVTNDRWLFEPEQPPEVRPRYLFERQVLLWRDSVGQPLSDDALDRLSAEHDPACTAVVQCTDDAVWSYMETDDGWQRLETRIIADSRLIFAPGERQPLTRPLSIVALGFTATAIQQLQAAIGPLSMWVPHKEQARAWPEGSPLPPLPVLKIAGAAQKAEIEAVVHDCDLLLCQLQAHDEEERRYVLQLSSSYGLPLMEPIADGMLVHIPGLDHHHWCQQHIELQLDVALDPYIHNLLHRRAMSTVYDDEPWPVLDAAALDRLRDTCARFAQPAASWQQLVMQRRPIPGLVVDNPYIAGSQATFGWESRHRPLILVDEMNKGVAQRCEQIRQGMDKQQWH